MSTAVFPALPAYVWGLIVLALIFVLYWIGSGTPNVWKLVEGADGRPSTSKLQWFLWTLVIVFSYTSIYAARIMKGNFDVISDIPSNYLTAMGFSTVTMATAKGITVSYVASGRVVKEAGNGGKGPASIFCDDQGVPDLSKIQMIAWTLVSIGIFLIRIVNQMNTSMPGLSDIDPALMVLMGLGQGAYLGKKLTTTDVARLTGLTPASGRAGVDVTIRGLSFGESQDGSLITIDDSPFQPLPAAEWHDTSIKLRIPATQPNGQPWAGRGQVIHVGVIVAGRESANKLPFSILP